MGPCRLEYLLFRNRTHCDSRSHSPKFQETETSIQTTVVVINSRASQTLEEPAPNHPTKTEAFPSTVADSAKRQPEL